MEMKYKFTIILYLAISVSEGEGLTSDECSPANRALDKQACLDAIADRFVDTDLFWFGSSYNTKCPQQKRNTVECFSSLTEGGQSLSSLIFKGIVNGTTNLTTYLDVKYTAPVGSYNACYSTFETLEAEFTLDPLSDVKHSALLSRLMPEVSYESTPTKLYTLFIIDAANSPILGLYVDIPGDDFDSANVTVIMPYTGPLNTRANPYLFLLFEQEGSLKEDANDPDYAEYILGDHNNIGSFKRDWNELFGDMYLNNPIGINWLYADYDPNSAEGRYTRSKKMMNCAPYVEEALMSHNRSFIPNNTSLTMYLEVEIHNKEFSFDYCCNETTYPEKVVRLDPLTDKLVLAGEVRTGNSVKISPKVSPDKTADIRGKRYTVICVDPDVPYPTAGTTERPLLHMAGINAHVWDGVLQIASVLAEYNGPGPPDDKVHTYYFMMFEQLGGQLQLNSMSEYTGNECIERLNNRCLFDVEKFSTDNNLRLVGASWMRSQHDDYVKYASGVAQDVACQGRVGYTNPCPNQPTTTPGTGTSDAITRTVHFMVHVLMIGVFTLQRHW